jgi:hypothetical protein
VISLIKKKKKKKKKKKIIIKQFIQKIFKKKEFLIKKLSKKWTLSIPNNSNEQINELSSFSGRPVIIVTMSDIWVGTSTGQFNIFNKRRDSVLKGREGLGVRFVVVLSDPESVSFLLR